MSEESQNKRRVSHGVDLIAAERQRQIEKEEWTPEHDDEHDDESLSLAAVCYALPCRLRGKKKVRVEEDVAIRGECPVWGWATYFVPKLWPKSWAHWWWKPGKEQEDLSEEDARIRDLVKAGALIAAEIDRLQRKKG